MQLSCPTLTQYAFDSSLLFHACLAGSSEHTRSARYTGKGRGTKNGRPGVLCLKASKSEQRQFDCGSSYYRVSPPLGGLFRARPLRGRACRRAFVSLLHRERRTGEQREMDRIHNTNQRRRARCEHPPQPREEHRHSALRRAVGRFLKRLQNRQSNPLSSARNDTWTERREVRTQEQRDMDRCRHAERSRAVRCVIACLIPALRSS
jgi:hypothetical protein